MKRKYQKSVGVIAIIISLAVVLSTSGIVAAEIQNSTYTGRELDVSPQDTDVRGVALNNNGTKLYVVGYGTGSIYEYGLAEANNISTASFIDSIDLSGSASQPHGIAFSDDGSKMAVLDEQNTSVVTYILSTNFDVSTASVQATKDISSECLDCTGVEFANSGNKMYISAYNDAAIYEYSLSSPYDITSATFDATGDISNQAGVPTGVRFNDDGTKFFITDTSEDSVKEFELSSPYDITTFSLNSSFSVSSQDGSADGIAFSSTGDTFVVNGNQFDNVYEYSTSVSGFHETFNVEGFVKDTNNTGIDNATVTLKDTSANDISTTVSNSTGYYQLSGAQNETDYFVSAGKTGYQTNTSGVFTVEGSDYTVEDIILKHDLFNVSGYIVDVDGNGLDNATATLNEAQTGADLQNTTTNSSGYYTIENVSGGEDYFVAGSKSGYETNVTEVFTVVNSDVVVGNITLPKALTGELILQIQNWQNPDSTQPYRVIYENESGRFFVTGDSTVASNNTSVITVDSANRTLVSANVTDRTSVTASYFYLNTTENVTVAERTLDNIDIMPPTQFIQTFLGFGDTTGPHGIGSPVQWILFLVILMTAISKMADNPWAGIGAGMIVSILLWVLEYIGLDVVLPTVFFGILIGLVIVKSRKQAADMNISMGTEE